METITILLHQHSAEGAADSCRHYTVTVIQKSNSHVDLFAMLGEHRWWVFETTTLQSDGTRGMTSFQCGKGPDHTANFRPIKVECLSWNKLDDSERMDHPPIKYKIKTTTMLWCLRHPSARPAGSVLDRLYININVQRFRTVRVHTHIKREIHNSTTYTLCINCCTAGCLNCNIMA